MEKFVQTKTGRVLKPNNPEVLRFMQTHPDMYKPYVEKTVEPKVSNLEVVEQNIEPEPVAEKTPKPRKKASKTKTKKPTAKSKAKSSKK